MRKLLVALVVVSMALAVTAYSLWRDRESERLRADALQARIAALELQRPSEAPREPIQHTAPTTAPVAQTTQEIPATSSTDSDIHDDYMALRRKMLRDPKYYEASRGVLRLQYAQRRDELIRVLGISIPKADAIVDFWIDRQLRSEGRVLTNPTTEQEQLAQTEMYTREEREDEEKMRAIAGDELFPRYQEFIASRPSRNRAQQLRIRLASGNDVLRDDQFEPLIGILYAEQTRLEQEARNFVAALNPHGDRSLQSQRKAQQRYSALLTASNRRVHSSAGAILSPQQLAELDAMLRKDLESMQAHNLLNQMEEAAAEN